MLNQKIDLNTAVRAKSELISSDIDGEIVMMDIEEGSYYGLNNVASRIWQLVEKEITVSNVCDALLHEYDVDKKECEKEVIKYLETLVDKKLIDICNV